MPTPNMFIVYVADATASARFYSDLFDMSPKFESPRFITFDLGGGVDLALWSGHAEQQSPADARTSEVCLNVPGGPAAIDQRFDEWVGRGVKVVLEPHDAVFGRTFLVADPDGNLIRVAPVD
ncbi:VOC family protein [Nocardia sp. NBC_00416]|uniref:VOC family protein n=1 Tax=Nocardia sp. NBC_00416 TaxID=2975991 RepID=UPI002E1CAF7D